MHGICRLRTAKHFKVKIRTADSVGSLHFPLLISHHWERRIMKNKLGIRTLLPAGDCMLVVRWVVIYKHCYCNEPSHYSLCLTSYTSGTLSLLLPVASNCGIYYHNRGRLSSKQWQHWLSWYVHTAECVFCPWFPLTILDWFEWTMATMDCQTRKCGRKVVAFPRMHCSWYGVASFTLNCQAELLSIPFHYSTEIAF